MKIVVALKKRLWGRKEDGKEFLDRFTADPRLKLQVLETPLSGRRRSVEAPAWS